MSAIAYALGIARRQHRADGGSADDAVSQPFGTALSPSDETSYQQWRSTANAQSGHDIESPDYDMRGFWKSGAAQGSNGHFPDTYKLPSHPTFSDESIYSGKGGNQGGHWEQSGSGWTFTPGPTNISNGLDKTREYLKRSDPDVILKSHGGGISAARRFRSDGGITKIHVPKLNSPKVHVGPIHSSVPGRTDHLPIHTPNGSYVIPADVVSSHGEGNTRAGFGTMQRLFGTPSRTKGTPYGQGEGTPYHGISPLAKGGAADGDGDEVPLVVAGGELSLAPEQLMKLGALLKIPDMTLDDAHKIMDQFVLQSRADHIKTLKNLPAPRRD